MSEKKLQRALHMTGIGIKIFETQLSAVRGRLAEVERQNADLQVANTRLLERAKLALIAEPFMNEKTLKEALANLCMAPQGFIRPDAAAALASVLAGVLCSETQGWENFRRWARFDEIDDRMQERFVAYLEQEE